MAKDNKMTHILLIGLAVIILLILVSQYTQKSKKNTENFSPFGGEEEFSPFGGEEEFAPFGDEEGFAPFGDEEGFEDNINNVQPSESPNADVYNPVSFNNSKSVSECPVKDKLSVQDLLPKDAANSKWAKVNPAGQGDVDGKNFLTAGYLSGVNTVGPSLRNANMQLRSDPPIERMNVGPWNQSTIEYDASRKFFEIGGDC